jgi:heme-degrading monooxygenase HmoA
VILRLVRARVLPGRFDALRGGLDAGFHPWVRGSEGLIRAHVGHRTVEGESEVLFITAWDSAEAVLAAVGGDIGRMAPLKGVSDQVEPRSVDLYEVDESTVRMVDATPAVFRTSAGWIELGPDVEIQQELRSRMHDLPVELLEAYVGRRMRGQSVEVAFVSVWADEPTGHRLGEPIWPDISTRYDEFRIETYTPFAETG